MVQSTGSSAQSNRAAQNWNVAYPGFGRKPPPPSKQIIVRFDDLKLTGLKLDFVTLQQKDWLFRQGDAGNAIYLVDKGAVQLILTLPSGEQQVIDVAPHGTAVGLVAPFTGHWRGVGARALTDCVLIQINKAELPHLAQKQPQLYEALQAQVQQQHQLREKSKFLCRYWGPLETTDLHNWLPALEWLSITAGETVFEQGESSAYVAFVVSGRLQQIHKQLDGCHIRRGQIGPSQFAGSLPQLKNQPRKHAVVALRDSELIIMSQASLSHLCGHSPQAWPALVHDFASAGQTDLTWSTAVKSAHNIAFVPLTPDVPIIQLLTDLQTAVFRAKNSLLLTSKTVDTQLEAAGALLPWLDKQEQFHNYLLFQANAEWDAWSQRCIRQADQVVLVAKATAAPDLTTIEQQIQELKPGLRPELVLLHPPQTQPQGTAVWLAAREVKAHYHVRQGNSQDVRRLGRRLTGQAVGLVLSAGGARGFAHIGAYRALLEAGVEIDYFGGTSMGGLIAAIIAYGYSYDQLASFAAQYGSTKALLDYTFPITSLCASDKITALLQNMFTDTHIEDLVLPYFCVSTNLSRSQPMVHQQGLLCRAVRASIAIPGVFAPVSLDGDLLVDGSVMNTLPIEWMHQLLGGGKIIAVNATPEKEQSRSWHIEDSISGWDVLYSRLNPFATKKRVPSLIGTLMQSLYVNSSHQLGQVKPLAHQFLQLETQAFGMMDWGAYKGLIEAGYQSVRGNYKYKTYAAPPVVVTGWRNSRFPNTISV